MFTNVKTSCLWQSRLGRRDAILAWAHVILIGFLCATDTKKRTQHVSFDVPDLSLHVCDVIGETGQMKLGRANHLLVFCHVLATEGYSLNLGVIPPTSVSVTVISRDQPGGTTCGNGVATNTQLWKTRGQLCWLFTWHVTIRNITSKKHHAVRTYSIIYIDNFQACVTYHQSNL